MITGIIVTALFFRLYRLEELMVFSGETNVLLYYIESYLAGGKPWLLGLEAASYTHHLFHSPWYLWMMIPVYFAGGGNPLVFAVFQAAIGAFGSYLMWRIGLMLGSRKIGLLAAFGYASSFHLSIVERFVSPVSMVPFGEIGIIYFGLMAKRQQKKLDYFLLGLWAGIAVSFHYALLLGALSVLGWVFWKQKKFFWLSFGGVILSFSPLLLFDLRHGFFNLT
ncbi:MAG TPA: glycosyltransferase family 39 protein, partial [Patescibacteria group bacterium]|nr:glycosyltransferase family 39 protein [Patescibacteria group bacterium]